MPKFARLHQLLSRWPRLAALFWRRDLGMLLGIALVLNLFLWGLRAFWIAYNPLIAALGTGVIGLNTVLAAIFLNKGHLLSEAALSTAIVVQILLLVLIVRSGVVAGS